MARREGKIFIGTSGWNYKHWTPAFYPRGTPARDYLPFYARHFDSVEVNKSFYRLLSTSETTTWAVQTPSIFLFVLKGSRFITHMIKLKNAERRLLHLRF